MDGENYVQWKSDPEADGLNLEELERYLKQHKESRYELWGANREKNPGRGERERQMHLNYGWWLRALRRLRAENDRLSKCKTISDKAYRELMEEARELAQALSERTVELESAKGERMTLEAKSERLDASACTCRHKLVGVPHGRQPLVMTSADVNQIQRVLSDWLDCSDTPEEWMRCRNNAKIALGRSADPAEYLWPDNVSNDVSGRSEANEP